MTPLLPILAVVQARAGEVSVASVDALRAAVDGANPGDVITLAPGTYTLDRTLSLARAGTAEDPITLRGGEGVTLESTTVEAIKVRAPHWHVEELSMRGACAEDDTCEHALHIVGEADGTWVRGCTLVDFNAQIKGNGEDVGGTRVWPDDVWIVGNDLHDTRGRRTANPVTKIDVVGGQRWHIQANRIADFQKDGGDTIAYAAFLKGHSKDGVFARNLVVCSASHTGGVRVGLSLGGGGTSDPTFCEDGTCTPEHEGGVLANNLIARCDDVGIYLNKASGTRVLANTLYATPGIDVRFEASDAELDGNVLDGRIRERDGGRATLGANLAQADLDALFRAPGDLDFTLVDGATLLDRATTRDDVRDDYCGAPRGAVPDLGALEYATATPCDTTRTHPPSMGGDTGIADTGTPDTGPPDTGEADTGETDTGRDSSAGDGAGALADEPGGCGCASGTSRATGGLLALLGALILARVRRARARP